MIERASKVTPDHLRRDAYVYIRQATVQNGFPKPDRLQRQYDLHQKAVALGWPSQRVVVIDSDLGRSGASTRDRKGLQKLIAHVSEGNVGIVLASDASRLARNCCDWHDLLDACTSNDTLIFLQDNVHDAACLDDRLLLLLRLALPMYET
jgi:DNA invertase Pin-like site-specific DNA recombinase